MVSYRLEIFFIMCSIEWSKKDTSIFIELLKERNCLWQIKCKEYNKVLRDMAIKAIAKHIVGIGQDDIKKKINKLRTPSFFYLCLSGKQMQARRCAPLLRTLPTMSTSRLSWTVWCNLVCAVWTAVVFAIEFRGPSWHSHPKTGLIV